VIFGRFGGDWATAIAVKKMVAANKLRFIKLPCD
jgi:hypothetical protein